MLAGCIWLELDFRTEFWQVVFDSNKKVNRKFQEEPQAEAAANPDTRRKRKSDKD